jgi:hypothetical protein
VRTSRPLIAMTEKTSGSGEEDELVVDNMYFIGSDSHEYRCPRGTSQKLATDQCCSCPVVGMESIDHVEVSAFWSKSVDVLCQGSVVHSFWYAEDIVLKIKILPMETREPGLNAEDSLVVAIVLIVATLKRGIIVHCVGIRRAPNEDRFRCAYITELSPDLSITFDDFRIRDVTASMVGEDGLLVTTSSVRIQSLSIPSYRVVMSHYSLPDVIATVCDHLQNQPWTAKESRSAIVLESKSNSIEYFSTNFILSYHAVSSCDYSRHEYNQGYGSST